LAFDFGVVKTAAGFGEVVPLAGAVVAGFAVVAAAAGVGA